MKDFERALPVFMASLSLTPHNPQVTYYIADTLFHLGFHEEAEEGFGITVELCGEEKEHQVMKEQALLLQNSLNYNA